MSLTGAYEPDNIFARIVRGEIPSAKLYEDDAVLAILDAFPQARGHALVIHKTSNARNILDVEPEALNQLILAVQKVARGLEAALQPDGLVVTQFNGAPAGQTIFHLHFHIIPRFADTPLGRHGEGGMADAGELATLAAAVSAEIATTK
jgi:histidine triad (HIT) family protein